MERLYRELARGKPVAEALRGAKVASLAAGDPAGMWAAFSVVGDPTVVVPLREPVRQMWWGWAGGLVVVIAAVAARRRRGTRTRPSS